MPSFCSEPFGNQKIFPGIASQGELVTRTAYMIKDMSDGSSPHENELAARTRTAPVQVQCENFRCLAFQDKEGRWFDYHNGKTLPGRVYIVDHKLE